MKRWFLMILVPLLATAVMAQTGAESVTPPPALPAAPAPSSEAPPPALPPAVAPAKKATSTKKKAVKTPVKKKTVQKSKAATTKASAKPAASASKTESSMLNPPVPATVKKENVNLRGRPSLTAGEVITKLKKGETVLVLEEITLAKPAKDQPAKWARVALPTGIPVWVSGEFVDPATKSISAKKLNFRAGAGENYSVLGRVLKGTPVNELRKNKGWIEIEAPTNAYAFVAADYLEKGSAVPPPVLAQTPPAIEPAPVAPVPPPEVVNVPVDTNTIAAAQPVTQPVAPTAPTLPTTEPATAAPVQPAAPAAIVSTAPENEPDAEPPPAEPVPKRIVTHEGIVRAALNIQAPADFELHDATTGELLNYLSSDSPDLKLQSYIDVKVMVTGEEMVDRRWQRTPILDVETIETP